MNNLEFTVHIKSTFNTKIWITCKFSSNELKPNTKVLRRPIFFEPE